MKIFEAIECNKTLFKLWDRKIEIPVRIGFWVYENMKKFNEVEEFLFTTMSDLFGVDWSDNIKEDEKIGEFYETLMNTEIDLEVKKMKKDEFLKENNIKLLLEDIEKLSLIVE